MKAGFKEGSRKSGKLPMGKWIIALIIATVFQASCKGNASNGLNQPLRMDLDLTRVVLRPEDISDLLQGATYSITQAIATPQSRGESVTYPTEILPHTTAFAKGFLTRIEIFKKVDQAVKSYESLLNQQTGKAVPIIVLGDVSNAFMRPALSPEGFDLDSIEYAIIFREQNAVGTIILRTNENVPASRLDKLAKLVVDRLSK